MVPLVSLGSGRTWQRAVAALVPVALATAACGGGSAGKAATSSTTTSSRATSTTAGPSAPSQSTTTTRAAGTSTTGAGRATTTSSTTPTSAAGAGSTSTTARAPETVRVDAGENGRTVSLHVGDTLQIVLSGCGGCGYQWRMTGQPSPVVFSYQGEQTTTASTTSTSAGQPPVVGQPLTYVWTFKAVGAHTTGFIAQYFPPGQGARASQTFAVQLRVSA